jgi:predicted nuclease of predicted toxin-antitoxin system
MPVLPFFPKDSDFAERSVLFGAPPKIIWIRSGNCTTAEIASLLQTKFLDVRRFVLQNAETCLILEHRSGSPASR